MKKLLAFILFLAPAAATATPTITSLSGTTVQNGTITIRGANMLTHADYGGSSHDVADHLIYTWKNFEDDTLISDGITSIENNNTASWDIIESSPRYSGSMYGLRFFNEIPGDLDRIAGLHRSQASAHATGIFYHSFWILVSTDVTQYDGRKPWRIWGNRGQTSTENNIYIAGAEDSSSVAFGVECSTCSPASTDTHVRTPGTPLGSWTKFEVWGDKFSDQLVLRRNNTDWICVSANDDPGCPNAAGAGDKHVGEPLNENFTENNFQFGHMIDNPGGDGGDGGWYGMDDLYATPTLAHVKLCNQSTWAEVIDNDGDEICEDQVPLAWTDDEVQVSVNRGQHAVDASLYLYVITENSTPYAPDVNASGFAFTAEEGGGPMASSSGICGAPVEEEEEDPDLAGTVFAQGEFTGANTTAIDATTPTVGGSFVKHSSYTATIFRVQDNRVTSNNATGAAMIYVSTPMQSANYDVQADMVILSESYNTTGNGLAGRFSASPTNSGVFFRRATAGLQMFEVNAGVSTQLGATVATTTVAGTYPMKMEFRDGTVNAWFNGVQVITSTTSILGAGFAGMRGNTASSTTGPALDNFVATYR